MSLERKGPHSLRITVIGITHPDLIGAVSWSWGVLPVGKKR